MTSSDEWDDDDDSVGYGRPPASTRFPKGATGNPNGRPKKKGHELPFEKVLGRMVTIRDGDATREVTAEEALIMYIKRRAFEGNDAANAALEAIGRFRQERYPPMSKADQRSFVVQPLARGSPNGALRQLKMASKLYPFQEHARMVIEPWLVMRALQRLGDRRLSRDEQEMVMAATRTPKKVKWPEWWEVKA
jgi:hypothetical protein